MARDTLQIGDGITRRTKKRTKLDPNKPDEALAIIAAFERLAVEALQVWGPQKPIVEAIRREAAQLRAEDAKRMGCDSAYLGSDDYQARYRERSTVAWYVREMDANAKMAELEMADGRPWEAVSWAIKLAEALAEARLRHDWNRAAEVGEKQLDHAANGRAALRRQPAADRVALVQQLIRTGCSVRSAMRQVAAELGVAVSTISRDYYAEKRSRPVD